MSGAGDVEPAGPRETGRGWRRALLWGGGVLVVLIAALLVAIRYVPLSPQGRQLIQSQANGLSLGRFGRLGVEGLSGDLWSDLTIARLTVRDQQGVWLEADNVHLKWRSLELLRRRFHAQVLTVEDLKLIRRPVLGPAGPASAGGLPLSIKVDHGQGRIDMAPAFSFERGRYDVAFDLDLERNGADRGRIRARSLLHAGDHAFVDFNVGGGRPLFISVDAVEARGGALAGALGLPAKQSFSVNVEARGRTAQGQFTAAAVSGTLHPLEARGAWTPNGGEASGQVSLTASSLAQPYARRIGPEAAFRIVGRKAGPELFDLSAAVSAENVSLEATGRGDLGERRIGPKGLQFTVETKDLGRLIGGPRLGGGRISGVITQSKSGWRFAGQTSVGPAKLGYYSLTRAAGPLRLEATKGDLSVQLDLAGTGGQGSGFIGAAFGPAPRASFQGERLRGGRLVLKRLVLTGSGLKVDASGGRGLLGRLTFEGRATLTNVAAARPGASGAATASWRASQAHAGQPWTVSVDVDGERFATGYPALDRLLGAKPQLRATANVGPRHVAIGSAVLNGANLKAQASGTLARDGALALKLDWNASGPLQAGPVEISGRAHGSGAISGTLGQPRADLLAHIDTIDVPRLPLKDADLTLTFVRGADGSSGRIAATAQSAYGPARGRAVFAFPAGGVDLTDLAVDAGGLKASGSVSLRHGGPSAADLDVAVTDGAFLDSGRIGGRLRIVDGANSPQARLELTAENARAPGSGIVIHAARFSADGPLAHLPYAATADGTSSRGAWGLDGRGVISEARPGYLLSFDGSGRLGGRKLRTVEPATFKFGGGERAAHLRLVASDGGRIDLDSRFAEREAQVQARVVGLGMDMLDEDLAGRFDASLELTGHGDRLGGTLEAKLAGARARGSPAASGVDGRVTARLSGDLIELTANATNAEGLKADTSLALPVVASAAPFGFALARDKPLRGRFFAEGEVRPLWDLLVGGERTLAGHVSARGTLGGTLSDPTASGQIAVDNGRFDDGRTGLSLRQVSLRAGFAQDNVDVTQASGVDGHGGAVTGSGRISLLRNGVSSFRLDLKRFRLIDNELAQASATGRATIERAADGKVRLKGALTIDQANVSARLPTPSGVVPLDVVEINRPADLAPLPKTEASDTGGGWLLDVSLRAPGRVYLRGRGLNLELSLDAHVGGTTSDPQLTGTAHVVRGDYDFAGKRFEFDPTSVVYLSQDADRIRLDLTASWSDPTLTANVHIGGTAARPELTLTSTPALPSDEVLSEVLFGRSASQLSGVEAAQVASAISSLAGGGGFDVVGNLRTFAGLDRLAFGGDASSGVTVSGGKYLTRNVYLEITGGGRTGPSAQVEWRVKRNLSIVSKLAGEGDSSLSVRWRRDY